MYVCMYACMLVCLFVRVHRSIGCGGHLRARHPLGRVRWLCCASPSVIDGWGSILSTSRGVPARESFPSSVQPHPALSYTLHYIHTVSVSPPSHRTRARRAHLYLLALHWISSSSAPPRPGRYIYARGRASSPMITSACHTCSAY